MASTNAATAVTATASMPTSGQVTVILQMPPSGPKWTEEVQAIATPVVALIAAAIAATFAYRQWRTADSARETARNKLKLDLFDKRYAAYTAATSLFSKLSQYEIDEDEVAIRDLMVKLGAAEFLFNKAVGAYIVEVKVKAEKALAMSDAIDVASARNDNVAQAVTVADQTDLRNWFRAQHKHFLDMVGNYLRVTH